jgi:hypothetical protein
MPFDLHDHAPLTVKRAVAVLVTGADERGLHVGEELRQA